jgi:ABC-type lipoprotein export system ATPase subunit
MEKLEENDDNDEIICEEVIEENEEHIIKNALGKLNKDQSNDLLINELSECYKSKKKLERLEDRLIKKIYEKFSILEKIDIKDPIDFVYTYNEVQRNVN